MAHTRLLFPVRVGVLSFCTGRKTRESRGATEELNNKSSNRPYSIYQHSNMDPRLSGQNCNIFEFLLSLKRDLVT